jgi:hypothetical protein
VKDRLIYGSYDETLRKYLVSADPPDAPVRKIVEVDSESDVNALAKRRRARVFWWPTRKPR